MGVEKWKGQNYGKLRRDCIAAKALFKDPLFPSNENSLNLASSRGLSGRVVWKRPTELCDSPRLFVEKASSKDVTQGRLGNCWFVAAASALATVKALWQVVVPDYKAQEWDPLHAEQYAGIFHFRFWRFNQWIDVVVDDLLPVIDDELVFCHSTTQNEYWSALLEKAYAKLCGSYGAMDGGNLCDALVDFTSGLSEIIELAEFKSDEDKRNGFRKQLLRKHDENALMCCAMVTTDSSQFETRTKTGLVLGHAYSITAIRDINLGSAGLLSLFKSGEKLTLLRLRNPWGGKEWTGPFSDGEASNNNASGSDDNKSVGTSRARSSYTQSRMSVASCSSEYAYSVEQCLQMNSRSPEWTRISKTEKEKLGLTFEDDGEFWMPYEDFIAEFTNLSICHLFNTSFFSIKKTWREHCFLGEWTKPNHAGGCPNHDTFLRNPQFCFDIPRDDMELVVQLMQTDTRAMTNEYKSIGFHIMKVEANREHRCHKAKPKAVTSDYVKARSVYFQGTLNKGRHVLVPSTFEPNVETQFMLRIFTEKSIKVNELKEDYPEPAWICAPFCSPPSCVTLITVEGATGLPSNENTFCIIKIEGQSLQSDVVYNSQEPVWNLSGIFFRYDICKPIFIELWERKILRDRFLGCAVITGAADNVVISNKLPLVGRGRKASERHPGELKVSTATYDDLNTT